MSTSTKTIILSDGTRVDGSDHVVMLKKQYEILMHISKGMPKRSRIQLLIADANMLGQEVKDDIIEERKNK